MGKNMKRLLLFAIRFDGWHSWGKDRSTCDALRRLCHQGFIETNEFKQFRLDKHLTRLDKHLNSEGVIQ